MFSRSTSAVRDPPSMAVRDSSSMAVRDPPSMAIRGSPSMAVMHPPSMAWPFCLSPLPAQILCLLPALWVPYSLASKYTDVQKHRYAPNTSLSHSPTRLRASYLSLVQLEVLESTKHTDSHQVWGRYSSLHYQHLAHGLRPMVHLQLPVQNPSLTSLYPSSSSR